MIIQNPLLTGSLSYNGADLSNVTSSNANSASVSLILTAVSSSNQQLSASYISLSASYNTFSGSASTRITTVSSSQQDISSSLLQVSASYIALSGSYNIFSGSASTRVTKIENNYATTGSNSFRADQSITGSLVVSSTITAQTLVVQTVTSSIVYSSGSNIFGNALTNTQTFTGSVNITGSINQYGTLGIAGAGANFANAAPRAMIDFRFNADRGIRMSSPAVSTETVIASYQGDVTSNIRTLRLAGDIIYFNTGDGSNSSGSVRVTMDNTGNVGFNTTSPTSLITAQSTGSGDNPVIAVKTNYTGNATIIELSQISQDGVIKMRSANGTQQVQISAVTGGASYTYFNNGSNVGIGTNGPSYTLDVQGTSGAYFSYSAASTYFRIRPAAANGTVNLQYGANSGAAPDLIFSSDTNAERMRITTGGNISIGGLTVPGRLLTLYKTSTPILQFVDATTGTASGNGFLIYNGGVNAYLENTSNGFMQFQTNSQVKLNLGAAANSDVYISSYLNYQQSFSGGDQFNVFLNGSGAIMYLNYQGNGAIKAGTGANTTLYAGSDIRIKENINVVNSTLNKLLQLVPKTYNYKDIKDDKLYYGFIAQEMEEVFPELVRTSAGISMCNDEEIIDQKSIESFSLVWASILTKAIQELQSQINELKAR
jgi:hypothetical protein